MARASPSSNTTAVAVRGPSSSNEISPKKSPAEETSNTSLSPVLVFTESST